MKKFFSLFLITSIVLAATIVFSKSKDKNIVLLKQVNEKSRVESKIVTNDIRSVLHITIQNEDIIQDELYDITSEGKKVITRIPKGKVESTIAKTIVTRDGGAAFLKDSLADVPTDFYVEKVNQINEVVWSKIYKGNDELLFVNEMIELNEGGYLTGGYIFDSTKGKEAYLTKINYQGEISWQKCFGGQEDDALVKLCESEDSGVFAVVSKKQETEQVTYLLKLDSKGNEIWRLKVGGEGKVYDLCAVGMNIVVASSVQKEDGTYECRLTKVSENGKIIWSKAYGKVSGKYHVRVKRMGSGLMLLGTSNGEANNLYDKEDVILIHVNEDGQKMWHKNIGGSGKDFGHDFLITKNYFIISGVTYSKDKDMSRNNMDRALFLLKIKR